MTNWSNMLESYDNCRKRHMALNVLMPCGYFLRASRTYSDKNYITRRETALDGGGTLGQAQHDMPSLHGAQGGRVPALRGPQWPNGVHPRLWRDDARLGSGIAAAVQGSTPAEYPASA